MQNQISPQQYAAYADFVLMTDEGMESIAPEIAGRLAELRRQEKIFNFRRNEKRYDSNKKI